MHLVSLDSESTSESADEVSLATSDAAVSDAAASEAIVSGAMSIETSLAGVESIGVDVGSTTPQPANTHKSRGEAPRTFRG